MVEKYNSTYHPSIKLKPTDARMSANYEHIHNALYAKVNARKATPPRFQVGDKVYIVRKKGTFDKGFIPNWAEEVFTITTVKANNPPTYTMILVESRFREPFTNRSCIRVCRKSTESNECSRGEKIGFLSSGMVTAVHSIRGYHLPTLSSYEHR